MTADRDEKRRPGWSSFAYVLAFLFGVLICSIDVL